MAPERGAARLAPHRDQLPAAERAARQTVPRGCQEREMEVDRRARRIIEAVGEREHGIVAAEVGDGDSVSRAG